MFALRRLHHPLASALLIAALGACSGGALADARTSERTQENFGGGGAPPFLDMMPEAHLRLAYRGIQRVELERSTPPVEYLEDVGCDGAGQFAVSPLAVIEPSGLDEPLFLGLAELRAGLTFRYRDFRISDANLFQSNYLLQVEPETPIVADVQCVRLRAERIGAGANGHQYLVDVDPTTGLVLRWEERDDLDALVARVGFESFAYDADLSDLDLQDKLFTAQAHNPTDNIESSVGFPVLEPALPPTGFVLDTVETMGTPEGEWVKFEYTDGLERVFLLHKEQVQSSFQNAASLGKVRTGALGSWTVVTGHVQGWEVILAGKVSESVLLDMLQSAL